MASAPFYPICCQFLFVYHPALVAKEFPRKTPLHLPVLQINNATCCVSLDSASSIPRDKSSQAASNWSCETFLLIAQASALSANASSRSSLSALIVFNNSNCSFSTSKCFCLSSFSSNNFCELSCKLSISLCNVTILLYNSPTL